MIPVVTPPHQPSKNSASKPIFCKASFSCLASWKGSESVRPTYILARYCPTYQLVYVNHNGKSPHKAWFNTNAIDSSCTMISVANSQLVLVPTCSDLNSVAIFERFWAEKDPFWKHLCQFRWENSPIKRWKPNNSTSIRKLSWRLKKNTTDRLRIKLIFIKWRFHSYLMQAQTTDLPSHNLETLIKQRPRT